MKHVRGFKKFRNNKNGVTNESVQEVDNKYRVRATVDVDMSLINSYVKKVKEEKGKELRNLVGNVDIAEEIVKYITSKYLNVESIPSNLFFGENAPKVEEETPMAETEEEVAPLEEAPVEETQERPLDEFEEPSYNDDEEDLPI